MPDSFIFSRTPGEVGDAVVVILEQRSGRWFASVTWPGNAETDGGDYLYATAVPLALERAEDARSLYGFAHIAVVMDDPANWNADWGTLALEKR